MIPNPCADCRGEGRRMRGEHASPSRCRPAWRTARPCAWPTAGRAGQRGGPSGSLFVHLAVTPDPRFERQGDNLHTTLTVSVAQAALGTETDVETLDGPQHLTMAPGTQHGHVERIRGLGVPHLRGRGRGDLFVHVLVATPDRSHPRAGRAAAPVRRLARARRCRPRVPGAARACSRACALPLASARARLRRHRRARRGGRPGLRRRPGQPVLVRRGRAPPRPGAAPARRRGGHRRRRARTLGPYRLAGRRRARAAARPAPGVGGDGTRAVRGARPSRRSPWPSRRSRGSVPSGWCRS